MAYGFDCSLNPEVLVALGLEIQDQVRITRSADAYRLYAVTKIHQKKNETVSPRGTMMIIDSHCHAGRGDGLTGPWDTAASLDKYLRRATWAGIDRTILFSTFHSDYAVANRQVARIIARQPDRFYGFAFVHAARDRGRIQGLVRQAVEEFGFVGIKVHRHDAPINREVCEAARAFALPVLYDLMGEVAVCELLAQEYPDVHFIIPHLGSFADDWRAQLALIDHLARHPNIYTDTSGVRRFDPLVQAVRRAGATKVLFGSDGPWLHPGVELAKVRALGLPAWDEAQILGGNLLRLIGQGRAPWQQAPLPIFQARQGVTMITSGTREKPGWA